MYTDVVSDSGNAYVFSACAAVLYVRGALVLQEAAQIGPCGDRQSGAG